MKDITEEEFKEWMNTEMFTESVMKPSKENGPITRIKTDVKSDWH